MEETTTIDLSTLSLSELDTVLKRYPWFSLARRDFFLRMSLLGEEYRAEGIRRAAVYVFSRDGLLRAEKSMIKEKVAQMKEFSLDETETPPAPISSLELLPETEVLEKEFELEEVEKENLYEREKPIEEEKPKIHIVGGDYFGKEDFEALQGDGLTTIERMKTLTIDGERIIEDEDGDNFTDEDFYTETLARIYTQQGFYKRASDVYSKLILLYPEKSTYFAALNEEIKKYL